MENRSSARQYRKKDWLKWGIPIGLGILVTVMTYFHTWIEEVYSVKIYPPIATGQRILTSWLPLSIGDLLYTLLGLWLLIKVITTIVAVFKRKITRQKTIQRGLRLLRFCLWVYIIFNLIWGWNYHRLGL